MDTVYCHKNVKQLFDLYDEMLWIRNCEEVHFSDKIIGIQIRYALKDYDSIDDDLDYDEEHYTKICLDFERSLNLILKQTLRENNNILYIKCEKWRCHSTISGNNYRYVSTRELHPTVVENKIRISSSHYENF